MKISRQAFYKNRKRESKKDFEEEIIVELVNNKRVDMPRIGGRKLYHKLKEDLEKLPSTLGRDKFFDILRSNELLVKPLKKYTSTTNSNHRFRIHPNLIKDMDIDRPNKVYVSDITYIRIKEDFCYLFLITDASSRKIVGYELSNSLATTGAVAALKMALKNVSRTKGLVHHSDRGFQYCSENYINLQKKHKIKTSMGQAGNPYDNAIAERVNGILKTEFYLNATFNSFENALKATKQAIETYNNQRPHMSLEYMTPAEKHAA